ncbi:phasin family protein [Massilia sp. TS11]|nr:phasin family protein [Massilia sp. TS11]
MSNKLCDSACRLSEMNVHLGQQMFEESLNAGRHMLNANDPVEITSIALSQMQPLAERMRSYHQQMLNVMAGTQAELTRTAESHIPEASRTAAAMADEMVKRANEETERAAQRQRSAMERMQSQATANPAGASAQHADSAGQPGQAQANGHHAPGAGGAAASSTRSSSSTASGRAPS